MALNKNPYFTFYRNSASPADGDNLGIMQFKGKNDAAEDVIYGRIIVDYLMQLMGQKTARLK